MSFVIVITAPDGTVAAVGTPTGRPWRTEASADELTDWYRHQGYKADVVPITSHDETYPEHNHTRPGGCPVGGCWFNAVPVREEE